MPPIGRLWPSDDDDGGEVGDCGDNDCDDDDEVDQWFSMVDISAISAFCCNFLLCQLEKVTCERTGGTSGRQELGMTLNKDCIYEACPEKPTVICLDLISV